MAQQRYKIVLLGEGRVGKTSILIRYIRGEFSDGQVSTLQASYLDKKIQVGGLTANLSVWDTAGQERYMTNIYTTYNALHREIYFYCAIY